MTDAVRERSALLTYLEMIKFEHSIFALPFAMIGMMWGSLATRNTAWPGWGPFIWIVVAMVSARSAAMAYNRIADRDIDAENPRTKGRAIPAGLLKLRQVHLFFLLSCVLLVVAAAMLNPLALALSPLALLITLGYSHTKRFTPLCHFFLGLSMSIAPAAAWIGVSGRLDWAILPLTAAVIFWGMGFDIIYSLQDVDFDRQHRLRSLPETLGIPAALLVSRLAHVASVVSLVGAGGLVHAGPIYFLGVALVAWLLAYEQSLVKANDLSKVNVAFFTLNGFVSIGLFAFALGDVLLRL